MNTLLMRFAVGVRVEMSWAGGRARREVRSIPCKTPLPRQSYILSISIFVQNHIDTRKCHRLLFPFITA